MGKLRHELWLFSKAQLSALVATVIDFGMTVILAELVGVWYVWATAIGAISGGVMNCSVNFLWVFDNTDELRKRYMVLRYFFVWIGSIALNIVGTYILTEWSGQYFVLMKIVVAVCVGVLWNYQLQRRFVYK